MGTDFCLVNRSKKERITFAHLPCTKSREITGNPVCAAIVTYYLIENAGDEIFFVSEHDFEEHKEVHAFVESALDARDWETKIDINVELHRLGDVLNSLVIPYGGSAREPAFRYGSENTSSSILYLYRLAWQQLHPTRGRPDVYAAAGLYARILTLLANSRLIKGPQFIREALQITVPKSSLLYKIYCQSDALNSYYLTWDYWAFCSGH